MIDPAPWQWALINKVSASVGVKKRSIHMQDGERFRKGLEIRREVLGNEYVDNNLAGSDEFMMTFQQLVTELAWG